MPNICVTRFLGVPSIFAARCCAGLGPENFSLDHLVLRSRCREPAPPRHPQAFFHRPRAAGAPGQSAALRAEAASEARWTSSLVAMPAPSAISASEWERLLAFVAEVSREWGTRWLISTSRRTPDRRRRSHRRARAERERGRPLHRLPHRGPRHAAGGLRHGRGDRLHRGFEHHDLGGCLGAAAGGGVAPAAHRFTDEEQVYRALLIDKDWCRVLPIAALTPAELRRGTVRDRTRSRRTRSTRSPPSLQERLPQLFATG